jgi:hypothetical protein
VIKGFIFFSMLIFKCIERKLNGFLGKKSAKKENFKNEAIL